jgi:hypothetical protein
MIYEHTQPYQTAIGWCLGKEICTHAHIHEHAKSMPFTMQGVGPARTKHIGETNTRETKKKSKPRQKYYA